MEDVISSNPIRSTNHQIEGVRRKSDGSGGDCVMPPIPEVLRSTTEMAAAEGDDGIGALECPMHTGAF